MDIALIYTPNCLYFIVVIREKKEEIGLIFKLFLLDMKKDNHNLY